MGARGREGGKVTVTAATSLGDWKHANNEAVIKLLMLTSHTLARLASQWHQHGTTVPPEQELGGAGRDASRFSSIFSCLYTHLDVY